MSSETDLWLNTQTLIGMGRKAWHDDEQLRANNGLENNHYPGFIPPDEVRRRLFNWQPVETDVFVPSLTSNGQDIDIVEMMNLPDQAAIRAYVASKLSFDRVPDMKALQHSSTGDVLGIHTTGYRTHVYEDILLRKIEQVVYDTNLAAGGNDSDEVGIGSAGLLQKGAKAWVQVELPTWITSRVANLQIRPRLLAATSLDGSMATVYKLVQGIVVCDNTLDWALSEDGAVFKFRHSKNSLASLEKVRDRLGIALRDSGEEFASQVDHLYTTPVANVQWERFLDEWTATDTKASSVRGAKAQATRMDKKRETMKTLWTRDPRVAPWTRTAWGVVQAVNTYNTWERTVKGASREERNMLNVIKSTTAEDDGDTLKILSKIGVLSAA